MMRVCVGGRMAILTAALVLAGAVTAVAQSGGVESDGVGAEPASAQPTLRQETLTIIGHDGVRHVFTVEVAQTPRQQQVGLMYRTSIPATSGMLFPWPAPQHSQMWMENCPVPEDMVFIGEDNRIGHIAEDTVPESTAVIDSGGVVKATLELQGGITAKQGIEVGDMVQSASLK